PGGQGHTHDPDRLRAAGLEHPLPEREPPRRVLAARCPRRGRAVPLLRIVGAGQIATANLPAGIRRTSGQSPDVLQIGVASDCLSRGALGSYLTAAGSSMSQEWPKRRISSMIGKSASPLL